MPPPPRPLVAVSSAIMWRLEHIDKDDKFSITLDDPLVADCEKGQQLLVFEADGKRGSTIGHELQPTEILELESVKEVNGRWVTTVIKRT